MCYTVSMFLYVCVCVYSLVFYSITIIAKNLLKVLLISFLFSYLLFVCKIYFQIVLYLPDQSIRLRSPYALPNIYSAHCQRDTLCRRSFNENYKNLRFRLKHFSLFGRVSAVMLSSSWYVYLFVSCFMFRLND